MNLARTLAPLLLSTTSLAQTATTKPAPKKPAAGQTSAAKPAAKTHAKTAVNWSAVPTTSNLQLTPGAISPDQESALDQLLLNRTEADGWGCEDDVPPEDWLRDLTFFQLPLGDVPAYLVVAGNTCGRSGAGSPNGALWIVAFRGVTPVLFADPQESLNGSLYSIQHTLSHGMPDLVVSWRLKPTESDLTWLKFDGHIYTAVAGAKLWELPGSAPRIEPKNYHVE